MCFESPERFHWPERRGAEVLSNADIGMTSEDGVSEQSQTEIEAILTAQAVRRVQSETFAIGHKKLELRARWLDGGKGGGGGGTGAHVHVRGVTNECQWRVRHKNGALIGLRG